MRVSVWWDIENCSVPAGINVFRIAQSITNAVRANGIKGTLQISAFGDVFQLPRPIQEGLSVTGVNLIHVPNGGKNSADRSILMDLMYWVSQNPPPAHIFLISGDRDFASVLHRLRMSNYNILLAGVPNDTSAALCSASSIMWNWTELARGENLSGRRFNQPPDGPLYSWYGQCRGNLKDPFEASGQQNSSKSSDSSDEEISSDKGQSVPKALLKQIRQIVYSYPYGVSITELRAQLTRNQVNIDRDFYGYKKFSRFLLSIPHVVKVVHAADGQLILRPVSSKVHKPTESKDTSEGFMPKNEIRDVHGKASDKTHSVTRMPEIEPILPVSSYNDVKEKAVEENVEKTTEKMVSDTPLREDQTASTKKRIEKEALDAQGAKGPKVEVTPAKLDSRTKDEVSSTKQLHGNKTSDAQVDNSLVAPGKNPKSETGLFRSLWTKWFSGSIDSEKAKCSILGEFHACSSSPERSTYKEGSTKSTNQLEIHTSSLSSSSDALSRDAKSSTVGKSGVSEGFIAKVMSWFRPWMNESPVNSLPEPSSQEPSLTENSRKHEDDQNARKNELFSDESFWSAIESFLRTSNGSSIVLKSTSRVEFARWLQNSGLLVVQSFKESDLLHLVDLLVSEKKWVRKFPSKIPHFKIILPPEKRSASAQPHNPNGLSSIFSGASQENPPSRVSSIVCKKPSEKTRVEILGDCKKLLDELFKQHPEGFNMGCFRKQFIEKYGYSLDYQNLGYPNLASLLQIMAGVKIESRQVLSDSVVYAPDIGTLGNEANFSGSDSEIIDPSRKQEDVESLWEELGPVSDKSNLSKQEVGLDQDTVDNVYEPCASEDDEFSDPEEEGYSTRTKAAQQRSSRLNEDESSLLQILDSWYSSKDESSPRGHASDIENSEDRPQEETRPPGSSHLGDRDNITAYHAQKQRPRKSYTFVSESEEDRTI